MLKASKICASRPQCPQENPRFQDLKVEDPNVGWAVGADQSVAPKTGNWCSGEKKNSHFFVPCSLGSPGAAAVARKAGDNLIFSSRKAKSRPVGFAVCCLSFHTFPKIREPLIECLTTLGLFPEPLLSEEPSSLMSNFQMTKEQD